MNLKNCNLKNNIRCHSGGAVRADTYFEKISTHYNIQTIAYSYQTAYHTSIQIENKQFVKGGTGVTIQMAIDNHKEVFIFEQELNQWFYWDYADKKFSLLSEIPKISAAFAGIGSRSINEKGIKAIESLFRNTFE